MNHNLNIVSFYKSVSWVELAILVNEDCTIASNKLDRLHQVFTDITILASRDKDTGIPDYVNWIKTEKGRSQADIWNERVQKTDSPWVLFMEYDEELDLQRLPKRSDLSKNTWVPALLTQATGTDTFQQYYQIRMVPKTDEPVFEGKRVPNAAEYILKNNIQLSDLSVRLQCNNEPLGALTPEDERSIQNYSPQVYLKLAKTYYDRKNYVLAAAQFRHVSKMTNLLSYDRLAAYNGLAGCYVETYKWDKAMAMTQLSIEEEPMQYVPYLIQYRIHELNKHWNKSRKALETFYEVFNHDSRANYDKYISREDTLLKLGQLLINTGNKKKALHYFEKYYQLKNGNVDLSFIEMLLVLSIEESDYDHAVYFFEEIFESYLPDKLTEELQTKLNEFLSMFMVNGWYDYTYDIYDELYEREPNNTEYRRRLIVTLSKTNRIEKAKKLIASNL